MEEARRVRAGYSSPSGGAGTSVVTLTKAQFFRISASKGILSAMCALPLQ